MPQLDDSCLVWGGHGLTPLLFSLKWLHVLDTIESTLLSGRERIESSLRPPAPAASSTTPLVPSPCSSEDFESANVHQLAAIAVLSEVRFNEARRCAIRTRRRMRLRRQRQRVVLPSSCSATSGPESHAEVLEELHQGGCRYIRGSTLNW